MKLNIGPFEKIKAGTKTVEIRLNDEKRQLLKVGDKIVFSLATDESQKVETEVVGLDKFKTFKELFMTYPPESYGSVSQDEWGLMYGYYSKEDEGKFGAVGVKVRVI